MASNRVRLLKNAEFTVILPQGYEIEQIFTANTFIQVTRVELFGDGYADIHLVNGSILKEVLWDNVFEPHGNTKEYIKRLNVQPTVQTLDLEYCDPEEIKKPYCEYVNYEFESSHPASG